MSFAGVLTSSLFKEVRALALPSLTCVACMLVPAALDAPQFLGGISIPAYFLGTAALGALSIGHEYSARTLSLLLSLPARRERILAVKLGVLAAALLLLWFVARSFVFAIAHAPRAEQQMAALVPVLCGLFVAPCLTMACRNPIAGTVFTVAVPGILLVAGEFIGIAKYGPGHEMSAFRMAFVWFGTLGFCATGGVMSWWLFKRLEVIDGPGQHVRLPQWVRPQGSAGASAQSLTTRNPVWLLVRKELRIQQLPLVLAALYVLEWPAVLWLASTSNWTHGYVFSSLTILHTGLLSILIGTAASASEREMGTLEWQVLLPMTAAKQWAIKASVVLVLTVLLGLVLPIALLKVTSVPEALDPVSFPLTTAVAGVMLLATGGLYVSSLCRSPLWALLMALPVVLGSTMFLRLAFHSVRPASVIAAKQFVGMTAGGGIGRNTEAQITYAVTLAMIGGLIAILLRFGFVNHRSTDRVASRVWKQAIVVAAVAMVTVIAVSIMGAIRLLHYPF